MNNSEHSKNSSEKDKKKKRNKLKNLEKKINWHLWTNLKYLKLCVIILITNENYSYIIIKNILEIYFKKIFIFKVIIEDWIF